MFLRFFMFFVLDLVQIVYGATVASARHSIFPHRLQHHALLDALFEPTILTPIALGFCNFARAIGHTSVHASILHGSFEESFAAFARDNAVMQPGRFVFTNHTHQRLFVFVRWMILVILGHLRTGPLLLRAQIQRVCLLTCRQLTVIARPESFHVQWVTLPR